MRRMLTTAAAVLGAAVLLLPAGSAAQAAQPSADTPPTSLLFTVDAGRTVITKDGAGYRVSIPLSSGATWFTDRPERRAGMTTPRAIASVWGPSGFAASPPNAAIVVRHGRSEATHVVTLTDPRIVGSRLAFTATPLDATVAGMRSTSPMLAGTYARSAIFIDDASWPVCWSTQPPGSNCAF